MEDSSKNYISLAKAAETCDYSQDYLSLRARQGKLKAVKFGRNWLTKKDWLDDYVRQVNGQAPASVEPLGPQEKTIGQEKYISLYQAASLCGYTQDYLSLRARQGKLKAVKFGRNWLTKKDWLDQYLINFNGEHRQEEKEEPSRQAVIQPIFDPLLEQPADVGTLASASQLKEQIKAEVSRFLAQEKIFQNKEKLKTKLAKIAQAPQLKKPVLRFLSFSLPSIGRRPAGIAVCCLLFILASVFSLKAGLFQGSADSLSSIGYTIERKITVFSQGLTDLPGHFKFYFTQDTKSLVKALERQNEKLSKRFFSKNRLANFQERASRSLSLAFAWVDLLEGADQGLKAFISTGIGRLTFNSQNFLKQTAGFFQNSLADLSYAGKAVAGQTVNRLALPSRTLAGLGGSLKNLSRAFLQKIDDAFQALAGLIKETAGRLAGLFKKSDSQTEKLSFEPLQPLAPLSQEKEGIIVVPSTDRDEEVKQKIKNAFSDEVKVTPQDDSSGIIVPVFRDKEGSPYLYMMVPVKE